MKILQVCPIFLSETASGSSKVAYMISKELVRRGHSVTVFASDAMVGYSRTQSGFEESDGIRIYRFRNVGFTFARRNKLFITPEMIHVLKKKITHFDITHLHEYRTFQNIVTVHYAKKHGVPYVLQAHGSLPRIHVKKRLKWIYDAFFGYRLLMDASKVISLSQTEALQYSSMGVPKEKIEVIPNGIDLYVNLPPKGSFKKKFNIPEDKKIILYLGRIHKIKGIDFLIKAYAYLLRNNNCNDAILVIAGPDDGYLSEAKELTRSLGISSSVLFPGFLKEKEKMSSYNDSTTVVYPSRYEPFGLVSLESAISSKPIMVAKGTPMSRVVEKGKFGFSVKYGDTEALAKLLELMIKDDALASEMGTRGRLYVADNCSLEKTVDKLERLYETLKAK